MILSNTYLLKHLFSFHIASSHALFYDEKIMILMDRTASHHSIQYPYAWSSRLKFVAQSIQSNLVEEYIDNTDKMCLYISAPIILLFVLKLSYDTALDVLIWKEKHSLY
jgi:hypothetical protein